ncbi:DUF4974 domain-containing protein [Sphingobacterium sp. DK4209]|uniref:DUF4974 domain-containing protein n=1 Tax=Sphingobacterium zhuxiongii TaxID=2662364 RepID=A0A5Q0Q6D9_9SPHI|nr:MULTISPECIES: FecR domain-containing protein [unclassified Sphingobacterium]MVZ64257.1 DUF4974 domain-containing protein [Sphingobacterium sp. DK4209]QGA25607.1 DUF4974 domain-containing protein [Sphingobacterium sp. dk4302]
MRKKNYLSRILLDKYHSGQCSDAEKKLVEDWYDSIGEDKDNLSNDQIKENLSQIKVRLTEDLSAPVRIQAWYRRPAVVAAIFITVLGFMISFHFLRKSTPTNQQVIPLDQEQAYLLSARGDSVNLTGMVEGESVMMGALKIVKHQNGDFETDISSSATPEFINLVTPPASQFRFTLPDGTRIHLNASSVLTFKTSFGETDRSVVLNGEAYFEVAKMRSADGKHLPFLVRSKGQMIKVLGTHFNVCAYDHDVYCNTTLLEGAVELRSLIGNGKSIVLRPGQKISLNNSTGKLMMVSREKEVEIDWKEGYYKFDDEKLSVLSKRLSRWYNVEIEVDTAIQNLTFGGRLSRKEDLKKAIEILEMTDDIKVDLIQDTNKTKLIIKPK